MGYVVRPHCLNCERKWPKATVGNAKSFVCICEVCKDVVNVDRREFRNELQPCPNCDSMLTRTNVVDMLNTPVDYEGTVPSGIKCPRCETGDLSFQSIMHFSMRMAERVPKVDDLVHGKIKDGTLRVPGMWLMDAEPTVEGVPGDVGEHPMELLTTSVCYDENSEQVKSISFRFVQLFEA